MAVKAHAGLAAIGIPFHHIGPGMEGRRGKTLLVDLGADARHAAIGAAQTGKVGGIAPDGVDKRHSVRRGATMMERPYVPRILSPLAERQTAAGVGITEPARG